MVCPPPMGKGRSSYACERTSSGTNSCRGTDAIAASTTGSMTPRRRNCFSIISARRAAYSFFSSMRNRRSMFFPCACFQDLFDLRERKITFIFAIVEMRRDAHASFGTVVDEDVPREEFTANLIGMRALDRNCPRALHGILWRVHAPAARSGAFDEPRGHAHRFFADCHNATLVENLQSRLARIERGNMRSAIQITERIVARIDRTGFKRKRIAMRHPSRERGAELGAQIFADVKVSDAGSSAEPLQDAADRKINTKTTHIERDRSCCLKNVKNHMRADAMRAFHNRACVHNVRAAEKNLRNRDEKRRFVDSRKQLMQINSYMVRSRNDLDAGAQPPLLVIEILNRRKLQLDHHDFVARPAEIKARRNYRLGKRHILVQRNFARARSDQRCDFIADAHRHVPPALFPGAHPAFPPGIRIGSQALVDAAGHRAQ